MRALLCCASLAAFALSACATPTVYQPATSVDAVGYSEIPLEDRRFRVNFRTGSDVDAQQARDYALRRAAELTLERGYDWFAVTERFIEPAVGGGGPRFSLGLGGADFGGGSAVGGGVGVGFGGTSQTGYVTTLEIVLGEGPKPESVDAYDARSVADSLGRL
jgi:hypothetical protein